MMKYETILFDPKFIEEAVFSYLTSASRPVSSLASGYYKSRDEIYERCVPEKRNQAFDALHDEMFLKLGLGDVFARVVVRYPLIEQVSAVVYVKRVWTRKQEGSELYRRAAAPDLVLINVQAARVVDSAYLERFLHHELMHVSDMYDPSFDYAPDRALGGTNEMEDQLIRERFRLLWDLYVAIRVERSGIAPLRSFQDLGMELDKCFSVWAPEDRRKVLADLTAERSRTQEDLLSYARDPKLLASIGKGGFRCPLCGFLSRQETTPEAGRDPAVIDLVRLHHLQWTPDQGICRQCFDLYAARRKIAV